MMEMSRKDESDDSDVSTPNRREVLQMMGGGTVAASGLSSLTGKATAEGQTKVHRTELSGSEAKKYTQNAISTEEFRKLRQRVEEVHGGSVRIAGATVYEVTDDTNTQQVVSFPVTQIDDTVESSVALRLDGSSVTFTKGVIAKSTDDQVSANTLSKEDIGADHSLSVEEFKVASTGTIKAETKQVSTEQATIQDGQFSTTASSSCVDPCAFALNAACPGMCGLGGAAFCAIVTFNSGGLASFGCGSFFVLYCIVVDYANPCFYKSSPEEDCREIICPKI